MNYMKVIFMLCLVGSTLKAENEVISIWPDGTPGIDRTIEEKVERGRYSNIYNPTIEVFKSEKSDGSAIIIFPGGGYSRVCTGHEGKDVAAKFTPEGVTCFVLKYRLPKTKGAKFEHPVSLSDAQHAIKYVRHNAKKWQLDPKRIGIMGFSAGGHLASMAGTLFDKPVSCIDEIGRTSCRPDFMVLVYPVINTFTNTAIP